MTDRLDAEEKAHWRDHARAILATGTKGHHADDCHIQLMLLDEIEALHALLRKAPQVNISPTKRIFPVHNSARGDYWVAQYKDNTGWHYLPGTFADPLAAIAALKEATDGR